MKQDQQLARFSNELILKSRYKLTPLQQKIVMYVATMIQPNDKDFQVYSIPVVELEQRTNTKSRKRGDFYKTLNNNLDALVSTLIRWETETPLYGRCTWFSSADPRIYEGILVVDFKFDPVLKPLMLALKEHFTQFVFAEMVSLTSGYAIRLYQILKAHKDKQSKHTDVGRITYRVTDLMDLLGVQKTLKQYKHFKQKVLKLAQAQLKENTSIRFEFEEVKEGRKVASLVFSVYPNEPTTKEVEVLQESLFDIESPLDTSIQLLVLFGLKDEQAREICEKRFDYIADEKARTEAKELYKEDFEQMLNMYLKYAEDEANKKDDTFNKIGFFLKALKEFWMIPNAKKALARAKRREQARIEKAQKQETEDAFQVLSKAFFEEYTQSIYQAVEQTPSLLTDTLNELGLSYEGNDEALKLMKGFRHGYKIRRAIITKLPDSIAMLKSKYEAQFIALRKHERFKEYF